MKTTISSALLGLWILTTPIGAETVIRTYNGEAPDFSEREVRQELQSLGNRLAQRGAPGGGTQYLVHHFEVDTTDPAGTTTLIAVRNEDSIDNPISIDFNPPNSLTPYTSLPAMLGPKETLTSNLRDVLGEVGPDPDGFVRGYILIESDGPVSVDFFQVTPGDAFAVGELAADYSRGHFCELNRLRFLIGGAFSGGTVLSIIQDGAFGSDPGSDPPSLTGKVYTESGVMISTFNVWTDDFSLELRAEDLVPGGTNFGTIDLRFENVDDGGGGGASIVTHDASGQFSVGLPGDCLDELVPAGP